MISRFAKEVAKKYLTQSLRLQPDYGERQSADFLGDRNVARNTGYGDKLKHGPGNAFDEIVADNDMGLEADLDADELEGFEIVDDMGIERMSEFFKDSRFSKGEKGREEFDDWMEDQPEDFQEEWESNTEKYKDVVKDLAEERAEKSADDIIDDIGLGRMASKQIGNGRNGFVAMWNRERVEVFADTTLEAQDLAQEYFQRNTRKRVKGFDITVVLAEKDRKQVTHRPMFASDRMAEDHDRGSYMSRQNLREMSDMADFIVDDIGMEGLDDWVEDKISQSYSAINDVARYRGYRDDDYSHGEESFKFAGRKATPFEIVTNWFAQVEGESEGEIEYMMGVDGDDEMSGDVEILSGHDIPSLIRDLKRDLRWSNIEFSKYGRRSIRWSISTQSSGFEGEHFRFADDEIIDDLDY